MEYLEGETLEQRLKKSALPFEQALRVGIQIADALSTAHRLGKSARPKYRGVAQVTSASHGR